MQAKRPPSIQQTELLQAALDSCRLLGTSEFYVPHGKMARLVQYMLQSAGSSRIVLNRPQVGGGRFVHNVEWQGIRFVSVSWRPMVVG